MAFGLGILKLGPQSFWAMTPRELGAAVRGIAGRSGTVPAPSRAEFAGLMPLYPAQLPGVKDEEAQS